MKVGANTPVNLADDKRGLIIAWDKDTGAYGVSIPDEKEMRWVPEKALEYDGRVFAERRQENG
jgi:hypothetical protein